MGFRDKVFRIDRVAFQGGDKQIPVLSKNYRSIALYVIEKIENPIVFMNRTEVKDFSDKGPLTQRGIRKCRNFYIHNSSEIVIGFHDHPNEMWISDKYRGLAEHCQRQEWLKIEGPPSERIIFKHNLSRWKLLLKIRGETDPTEKSFIEKLRQLYRAIQSRPK